MAGGMGKRGGGSRLTLAERSAAMTSTALEPQTEPELQPDPPGVNVRARAVVQRHCWVLDLPDYPGRWAGLLVEWARRDGGWRGRVVYAVTDGGQCVLVEAWVDAAHLRPA